MPIQKSSSRRATNLPARRLTGTTTSLNLPADLRRQQFRLDCGETDAHLPALFLDVFGWTRSGCVSCKAGRLNDERSLRFGDNDRRVVINRFLALIDLFGDYR